MNRRARGAKTDRLDAQGLLRILVARIKGDQDVCSVLRVRTIGEEDAYLHHLVKSGEILGMMLLTEINLAYYQDLMEGMRNGIAGGRFGDFCAAAKAAWRAGEASA